MEVILVKEKITEAIKKFIEKDREDLLRINIYEPTLSHRIGVYLESLFPGYYVDCEYNKHLSKNKKVINQGTDKERSIRPDIVIHRARGKDTENLAIFEIKKSGKKAKKSKEDIEKLKNCVTNDLNYKLGVFIGILKKSVDIIWIEKDKNDIEISI